ncbi:MAG: hypothetical protein ABIJ56_09760 [Pseudomonadota bacterium]
MKRNKLIPALLAALIVALPACKGCRDGGKKGSETTEQIPSLMIFAEGEPKKYGPFEVAWDPGTGKGPVVQHFEDGSRIEVCFHCGYKGYTGGLSIGSFNAPGFMWVPAEPVRGFKFLNIWCAFDETIHEPGSGDNYTFGWSQNFGEKGDGERLAYERGAVLWASDKSIVLEAVNKGGCYLVKRRVKWVKGDRFLVFSTIVENTCRAPAAFEYWLGEDPWIGTYKSSDGDVGWAALHDREKRKELIVRSETKLGGGGFDCGGLYDLGNVEAGDREGGFSNVANFISLSPMTKKPAAVCFANRFAHGADEIIEGKALDNKTLTAMNMGWTGIVLAEGQAFRAGWAAGIANTAAPPQPPSCPELSRDRWFALANTDVIFEREKVDVEITQDDEGQVAATVTGDYFFYTSHGQQDSTGIFFPFYEAGGLEYPHEILVDGTPRFLKRDDGITFSLQVPGKDRVRKQVAYTQKVGGCAAGYVTTSAKPWGIPLKKAEFSVTLPESFAGKNPVVEPGFTKTEKEGKIVFTSVVEDFVPEKDISITWDCT